MAFTIDGNPFTHRFFNTIPGIVALPINAQSMTGLHEFGHAASSYTDGGLTDQYVDSDPALNVKKASLIPASFGTLNATAFNSDVLRDGLGYPDGWTSFHPALTASTVPSLMDNYWLAPPLSILKIAPSTPSHVNSCVTD